MVLSTLAQFTLVPVTAMTMAMTPVPTRMTAGLHLSVGKLQKVSYNKQKEATLRSGRRRRFKFEIPWPEASAAGAAFAVWALSAQHAPAEARW
ncbi:hypothetical protein [Streptomyces sp. SJL17-4]|uniref:hypothetical protein n=1 Tax=Streptomyces sp. SJL17-4 TaxID=2967224 RepID=UPI0030D38A05